MREDPARAEDSAPKNRSLQSGDLSCDSMGYERFLGAIENRVTSLVPRATATCPAHLLLPLSLSGVNKTEVDGCLS